MIKAALSLGIRALALVLLLALPASAQLRYIETEHLRLVYIDGVHSFLAPHVVRCFENAYRFHHKLWDAELGEKVTVFLHDSGDQGNGGAKNTPTDLIVAAIAPFSYTYETMPANERMNTIMNHELAHIFTMDRTSGWDRFYRGLFGGKPEPVADQPLSILYEYLVTPRRAAPRWYQEGIAVFLETWMAGGYGRALGAYDEMVFRTMVVDSARFYDPVSLESEGTKIDLHVGVNSYIYGTRFYTYLGIKYGPEKVMQWVSRTGGTKGYFVSQFKRTFGVSLDQAWRDWVAYEHEFQQENLAAIRAYPLTGYSDLTEQTLGSVSRPYFEPATRQIYVAVDHPGELPYIGAINVDDGAITKLTHVRGSSLFFVTYMAFDPRSRTLFYTTDNYGWRDLRAIDVASGHARTLMTDARIGDIAFCAADSALWGIRHFNGLSTIVRIPTPYTDWQAVYVWPYGKDVYDLDVSHDGQWLTTSLAEASGRQTLIRMNIPDILAGDSLYHEMFDFGSAIPQNFVFSADDRYLYGSSFYTGVSNVFRYDIAADSMEAFTNGETGFFRPIPVGVDSLIVFRYTSSGFHPAMIAAQPLEDINPIHYFGQRLVETHPIVTQWKAGSPGQISVDSVTVRQGPYHVMTTWKLMSLYPVVEGYKSTTAGGVRLNFGDYLGLQNADVTATYTPEPNLPSDERWHVKAAYSYFDWDAAFDYNGTDFYDLFGPTKTSRKGYSASLHRRKALLTDEQKHLDLDLGVSGHWKLERLPDYQNVATSYDVFGVYSADLHFENMTASLGAVDYETGYRWGLSASAVHVLKKLHPQIVANAAAGVPLPIPHSSVWLRGAAGASRTNRDEPFDNFFFGGFGNNWVDHGIVKRYRQWYSFPGAELNELAGTNFTRGLLEWNLPPLRFRRLGFPALYCSWARCSIFAIGLATNLNDDVTRATAGSVGAQVDFQLQLLSQLKLTLSAGYGRAWRENMRGTDEVMVSLKVL